eukprot:442820-Pyramimonas_sp.AAC.1
MGANYLLKMGNPVTVCLPPRRLSRPINVIILLIDAECLSISWSSLTSASTAHRPSPRMYLRNDTSCSR